MIKGLKLYEAFIDGLVKIKNGAEAKRIMEIGYLQNCENKTINQLLKELTPEQKEGVAKMVQKARIGGIHDTLAYINEMTDCDGLAFGMEEKKKRKR